MTSSTKLKINTHGHHADYVEIARGLKDRLEDFQLVARRARKTHDEEKAVQQVLLEHIDSFLSATDKFLQGLDAATDALQEQLEEDQFNGYNSLRHTSATKTREKTPCITHSSKR